MTCVMNDLRNSPYFGYLCHYGVKGRSGKKDAGFWYKNGQLTKEGYEHYYGIKGLNRQNKPESSTWKSKDAGNLSDAELNRRNSRLQREQQYRQMTKSNKRKAAEWIGKTASAILVATAISTLKGRAQTKYRDLAQKYLPKAAALIKQNKATSFIKRKGASAIAAVMISRS